MKKIKSILLALTASSFFVSGTSDAASLKEREQSFKAADLNHDGRLTWHEFEQGVRKILSTRDDFQARGFRMLGPETQTALLKDRFVSMDTSHKGYLLFRDWHQ